MFGAAVAILLVMSLWDNVSLFSNDIFQLLAIFTIGCTICRSLIPDEASQHAFHSPQAFAVR